MNGAKPRCAELEVLLIQVAQWAGIVAIPTREVIPRESQAVRTRSAERAVDAPGGAATVTALISGDQEK